MFLSSLVIELWGVSRLTLLFRALSIFLYLNLDAIDGKQARRLGLASPLGQIFDHGCDALVMILVGLTEAKIFLGDASEGVFRLWFLAMVVPFYMINWEESSFHVMRFGFFSSDVINLGLCLTFALSGHSFSSELWVGRFT